MRLSHGPSFKGLNVNMKNHILIKRCLIGVLAYFLCALANAAIFKDHETGALTGDPLGFTLSYAASVGYGSGASDITDPCPSVPVGGGCRISLWAKSLTSGVRIARSFTRIKEDPCQHKKGQSAGDQYVPLPGAGVGADGSPVVLNKPDLLDFIKGGSISCDGTCEMISDGKYQTDGSGKNFFAFGDSKAAYGLISMKYTGQECTLSPDKKPPTNNPNKPNPNKNPKGPNDCPPNSSFGQVNGVNVCAKSPPKPNDPPPKPNDKDKDTCLSNCDKWDPDAPKPTDPKDPNKPTNPNDGNGGTGGTGTGTNTGTGTGNASGPANASGVASGVSTMGINDVVSDDLYKTIRTDKTPGPFEGYLNTLDPEKYPLFKQIKNFFKGVPSGSCPVWTIPSVRIFNHSLPSYNIDVFCSPVMMSSVYPVMKGVVLFISSFFAFRWAIL